MVIRFEEIYGAYREIIFHDERKYLDKRCKPWRNSFPCWRMGVKDLWTILSPVGETKSLWELQGKRVAVDLSSWVCESQFAVANPTPRPYLRNLFFRTSCLLLMGVDLVFVMDGKAPALKLDTMGRRNDLAVHRKQRYKPPRTANGKKQTNDGSRSRFKAQLKQCEELLKCLGITCVQSAGEAEALCAKLNEEGLVDGCITQDGDCFLYGAREVYRNFSIDSKNFSVDVYKMAVIEEKLGLTRDKLVCLAVLLGCDYYPTGIPGVGKESALQFVSRFGEGEVLNRLQSWTEDSMFEKLEQERGVLEGSHCPCCGHKGTQWRHNKQGCKACGLKEGCQENSSGLSTFVNKEDLKQMKELVAELNMRKKALESGDFSPQDILSEFLNHKEVARKLDLTWKRPNLNTFLEYSSSFLNWAEEHAVEKFLPLLTRWQVMNMNHASSSTCSGGLLQPKRIVRKRVVKGIASYEVDWSLPEHYPIANKTFTSTEPQLLLTDSYPDIVEEFQSEQEKKKKKKKPTGKKGEAKRTCELCNKLAGAKSQVSQQSHICKFLAPKDKPQKDSTDKATTDSIDALSKLFDDLGIDSTFDEDTCDEAELSAIINGIVSGRAKPSDDPVHSKLSSFEGIATEEAEDGTRYSSLRSGGDWGQEGESLDVSGCAETFPVSGNESEGSQVNIPLDRSSDEESKDSCGTGSENENSENVPTVLGAQLPAGLLVNEDDSAVPSDFCLEDSLFCSNVDSYPEPKFSLGCSSFLKS